MKLTIAIPTYNRASSLEKCLKYIFNQDVSDCEVIVSDNCSIDNTEKVVRRIINKHQNLKYYRNSKNLGVDRNFLNCYAKASGEYVLLLGDDDFLLPGSISSIMKLIEENPVILHLNSCMISNDNSDNLTTTHFDNQDFIFTNKNDMLKKMGIYITFVSGLVLKTKYVRKIPDKEKYIGTFFLQSHIALHTMTNEGKYIINGFNCLAETGNKKVSYDVYFVWIKCLRDLIIDTGVECGFDEKVLNNLYYSCLKGSVFDFILYYQKTCRKESKKWNKNCVWECIEPYPDILKIYKKVIDVNIFQNYAFRLLRRIRRFFKGKIAI